MNRLQKGGTVAALAVSVIGACEGLRQVAYPDPATRGAPWTICYGHTGDVQPDQQDSITQCKELLREDLGKDADAIDRCVRMEIVANMSDTRYVALLSFAYNVGVGAFCRSSVVRDLNAGRSAQACDDFLRYNRAAGVVFPGLTRRRQEERHLCMES